MDRTGHKSPGSGRERPVFDWLSPGVGVRCPPGRGFRACIAGSWVQSAIDRVVRASAESVYAFGQGALAGRVKAPPPVADGQLMPGGLVSGPEGAALGQRAGSAEPCARPPRSGWCNRGYPLQRALLLPPSRVAVALLLPDSGGGLSSSRVADGGACATNRPTGGTIRRGRLWAGTSV